MSTDAIGGSSMFELDVLPPECSLHAELTADGRRIQFWATRPLLMVFGWPIGEVRSKRSGWFATADMPIRLTWEAFWERRPSLWRGVS